MQHLMEIFYLSVSIEKIINFVVITFLNYYIDNYDYIYFKIKHV